MLSDKKALGSLKIPMLVMGVNSDVLYPLHEQEELVKMIPNASLTIIDSDDGHDAFLLAQDQVGDGITHFLNSL